MAARAESAGISLVDAYQPAWPMFVGAAGVRTQQHYLEDVAKISAMMRARNASHVVNLCEDRYHVAVVFGAALVQGVSNLLPPNRQPETLQALARRFQSPTESLTVIHDRQVASSEDDYPGAWYLQDFLDASAPMHLVNPVIAADQLAAQAFTSGSTGEPRANAKLWKTLSGTTHKLAKRLLAGFADRATIIATVPSQHMYGLEMSIMMALQGECIVHRDKPFYPQDIVEAIRASNHPVVLVTTPVHLRVLLQAGLALPKVEKIICATAPLATSLADEAEQAMGAVLEEIYGCTEAGSFATRRTTAGESWRMLEGMTIMPEGEHYRITGAHLPVPAPLQDVLECYSAEEFRFCGRTGDLINVGGKRASLQQLNQALLAVPGVKDGIVFVPEAEGSEHVRPAAFVVASCSEREILQTLSHTLDPVFLPRPVYKVECVLRNETGKVTRAQLDLMLRAQRRGRTHG